MPLASLTALALGFSIPIWSYAILRKMGGFDSANAAALAAHYGSVSAVTFGAVLTFLDSQKTFHEPFLPALLAMLEVPAILIGIWLYKQSLKASAEPVRLAPVMRELFSGKSIVLLVGGMVIGVVCGQSGFDLVAPVFDTPFKGVLCLFLLELGLVTGARLSDLRKAGPFLAAFSVVMPLLHGLLGVWLGKLSGLGLGGATVLGTLAASASYIAAPAAVRVAIPSANPTYYLTASLGITFPFNVTIGIPLYFWFAQLITG